MHKECADCLSLVKLQGALAAASVALCLYACNRVKRANSYNEDIPLDESLKSKRSQPKRVSTSDVLNVATTKVNLPKQKANNNKASTFNDELVLVERLVQICVDSSSIIPEFLKNEIAASQVEPFNPDQCIAAFSYEFATTFGAEKVQQADVTLMMSFLSRITTLEYSSYIELLVALEYVDKSILTSFEPMIVLVALFLLTANKGTYSEIDREALLGIFRVCECCIAK
ncbi:hypothetical protein BdWA1_003388 [Babesia duncani]|uniref:Uncharacterized protein n=1 Tax=Babesia duncani TaxID=323732 RepID=A0AAD9PIL7_9APIC|nr:hypothetical protein BdWA1_003388 [Babesia duncani]